ncbi:unnamed protein product [Orchesella dallaii]|uniref:Uncharacterized protein n=1 Tax=Orchesella dallaii TaxID=48710 RepID=A0ABP1QFL4_9HEXA
MAPSISAVPQVQIHWHGIGSLKWLIHYRPSPFSALAMPMLASACLHRTVLVAVKSLPFNGIEPLQCHYRMRLDCLLAFKISGNRNTPEKANKRARKYIKSSDIETLIKKRRGRSCEVSSVVINPFPEPTSSIYSQNKVFNSTNVPVHGDVEPAVQTPSNQHLGILYTVA